MSPIWQLFCWLNRFLAGDLIYTMSGWLAGMVALALYGLSGFTRLPKWLRIAYVLVMAFGLALLFHRYAEAIRAWYTTPMGAPMQLHK